MIGWKMISVRKARANLEIVVHLFGERVDLDKELHYFTLSQSPSHLAVFLVDSDDCNAIMHVDANLGGLLQKMN